jgi:hypothetical protein
MDLKAAGCNKIFAEQVSRGEAREQLKASSGRRSARRHEVGSPDAAPHQRQS